MAIAGLRLLTGKNYSIFFIDNFSEEFKGIIRNQLKGIWNGFAEADCDPEFYSYQNTLASFWDRYNSKSDDTKKGMIGELLSHIIINHYQDNLTPLSILKNKEERSIKKGFDIIYCQIDKNRIWYAEVKSGKSEKGQDCSTTYNRILLNRSKKGIAEMFSEDRNSLWESASIDVSLMIKENDGKINLKKLLTSDAPCQSISQKKNVILVSALYHNLIDQIDDQDVLSFYNDTLAEDIFQELNILSIQKNTFELVANFLFSEITTP